MPDVAMPRLSDSMEEGTILKWLKSDGDEVAKGEELVEIETDKANMTYEADQAGTLSIVAQEGDTLPVGETIARIGEDGGGEAQEGQEEPEAEEEPESAQEEDGEEEPEAEEEPERDKEPEGEKEPEREKEPEPAAEGANRDGGSEEREREPAADAPDRDGDGGADGRVKASPVARRMAREMGLELAGVQGTGPGGRIVKADVEAAARGGGAQVEEAEAPEEAPDREPEREPEREEVPPAIAAGDGQTGRGEVTHQDLTRLQQTVARRMAESKATAPDFIITTEVDMDAAVELRKQLKAASGDDPAPSYNDFVIKASALALRDFPRANAAYRDGQFELYGRVNVGVAVAGQDALVVPTLFDADRKGLGTIAGESRTLAERVRAGAITPPELSAGTFTVSNLGMYGIKRFVAVINPPQAAILAVGEMTPRPVVRDGDVTVRNVMELTLSCDHRILYGADAAQFLARIREYLENPLRLAL
jgi:pyruvate dehydrogenase E2 component (dihydrolipoamide acetyltransferase)